MNPIVATVISAGMATLRELDEYYGTQDMYDLLEIIAVDAHNRRVFQERAVAKARRR